MFNLEKGLGEIEATASAVIGKTDNDEQLSDGDRLTLAAYMAFQHTRTPAYRGWLRSNTSRRPEGGGARCATEASPCCGGEKGDIGGDVTQSATGC